MGHELAADPVEQLRDWVAGAAESGLPEPGAMALATASSDGRPSVRFVLLKEILPTGILFATNYSSRKAQELESNPNAAVVLYWQPLHRQVRIEGRVEQATSEESDRIFAARPRGARIGAWASHQSSPLADPAALTQRVAELARAIGEEVPRPEFWGAYRIVPESFEFWIGRKDRLHERFVYRRQPDRSWSTGRLSP
jgi:pyridoxamine 5'-phosphate oxidase